MIQTLYSYIVDISHKRLFFCRLDIYHIFSDYLLFKTVVPVVES